jgi:DNA-binding NtrC family response regulator
VSSATQLAPCLLRVLLVGGQQEDFFLIREILDRNSSASPTQLDHVGALEEAKAMLQRGDCELVLFEHETGNAAATKLPSELLHTKAYAFIVPTEHAHEKAVGEIIQAGAYDCMERSQLTGANLARTIRYALNLHATQPQQVSEQSLPSFSCAVEQLADTHL